MTDLYEKFTRGAWLAVPILIAIAVVFFLRIEYDAHQVIADYQGSGTLVKQNMKILGGAGTDLEKTLREEHQASSQQIASGAQLATNFAKLLSDTDSSLNGKGGALPTLTSAIADQDANMTEIAHRADDAIDTLNVTMKGIQPILAAALEAAQNGANLSGDPALKEALEKLDVAMDKVNDALASADLILASGGRDAGMIETRLREALKPASLAKQLFEEVLHVGPPVATAVGTFK